MAFFLRSLWTALLCGAAVFAGDVLFRGSLLQRVHPVLLTPQARETVRPPLRVTWVGPESMELVLTALGQEPRSLGVHSSPFDIPVDEFRREGGYQLELRDPAWGTWIRTRRSFQVFFSAVAQPGEPEPEPGDGDRYLLVALDAARQARDKARTRVKSIRRENYDLRAEADRLNARIDELYEQRDHEDAAAADLEQELVDLAEELRGLREENLALRLRLSGVNPCTAWGYMSYPRPQTIPPSRRIVRVSDVAGNIFRREDICEAARRSDSTADSTCFCVGDTWRGSR